MLTQVRLLAGVSPEALIAAPPETLARLEDIVPDPRRRLVLSAGQLVAGVRAGRWARQRGAALLHGHGLARMLLFFVASRAARLPLVVTLHNLVAPLPAGQRRAASTLLGGAARVIAVSEAVARSARQAGLVAESRLRVVPNGVEIARFRATPARRDGTGKAVALCVARLSPEKGVDLLVEAMALAGAAELFLRVAGDGPEEARLRERIRASGLCGRVELLGRRDDIPDLLASADLYCQPSRDEGLGMAALEAMASGLPVVATRVGGLPEVVQEGRTGLLVPSEDPAALAAALTALAADLSMARRMGAAGRARVEAQFTAEAMRQATARVYAEALGR